MKNEDFSWDKQSLMNDKIIATVAIPNRFALTAPQVVMNIESNKVLLIDPHASGTWETWMFPYASLILNRAEIETKCEHHKIDRSAVLILSNPPTFGELSKALKQLRKLFNSDYTAAIAAGVNNVLPQLKGGWNGKPFYENYSLKFSKTSMSYTAYVFEYYINFVDKLELGIPHVWVDPGELLSHLESNQSFQSRLVSSNVVEALPEILKIRERSA